jgi:hypothetical protein
MLRKKISEYSGLIPPFFEDMIIKVSPEGIIEKEISLIDVIYKSGYTGLLRRFTGDILHLNDVEVLDNHKADAFTGVFNPGDIMVSMRHANAICIIDANTEKIKWCVVHPFFGQHDPDFTENGYITVFDNYSDWKNKSFREKEKGSRIIRINPVTKETKIIYGWHKNQYFYTEFGGKHQQLPNQNMIITETDAGRIFEINPKGKVVWEWIVNQWDKDHAIQVMEGARYGPEYADFIKQ